MKRMTLILLLTTSLCLSADWIEQQKILPSDGSDWDRFGSSVSVDGDYAVVGANFDDDDGEASGSAYIFKRLGDTWSEQAKITASDGAFNDHFGCSVSIDGEYTVIGACREDDNGAESGSAYIFKRIGDTWSEQAKITASDGAINDHFGYSVSISGDYAVIGVYDNIYAGLGSAYVFHRTGTIWSEQANLAASDGAPVDFFGSSVSISGDYAVIGAFGDDDNGSASGSAYIFHRDGTSWSEQAKIIASDGSCSDRFGWSVSISGDYVLIGTDLGDDSENSSGSAYIFHRMGTTWFEQAKITATDGESYDFFGSSVSLSGDYAVIGAFGDDDTGDSSGSAYIFNRVGNTWNEQVKIIASDGEDGDGFGFSVSISGDYTVIGVYRDDDNGDASGSAYIFHNDGLSIDDSGDITNINPFLLDNYPNPFFSQTTISFNVTHTSRFVTIEIYNIKGQKIKSLECNICDVAETTRLFHSITWDGTDRYNNPAASGIYLYELNVDNKTRALRKCLLLR